MKKTLFGGIAALSLIAFLASGCARETVESKSDKLIKFTTVVGKQTRAAEFEYWESGDQISVASFPAGSAAPFRAFGLTHGGGGLADWTYDPPVPQPGVPLVFFSIYPDQNVTDYNLTGRPGEATFDYKVPTDDLLQQDLVAAFVEEPGHLVNLTFEHLLSQVNFGIRGLAGIQYEVTDINLTEVANEGTFTFGGGWSVQGSETFPYRSESGVYITPGDADAIFFLGNHPAYNSIPAENSSSNALMLLPQNLGSVQLSFNYAIHDGAGTVLVPSTPLSVNLSNFGVPVWDPSTRYVYVLDFTGEDIAFTVDVMPWQDYNSGELIIVKP